MIFFIITILLIAVAAYKFVTRERLQEYKPVEVEKKEIVISEKNIRLAARAAEQNKVRVQQVKRKLYRFIRSPFKFKGKKVFDVTPNPLKYWVRVKSGKKIYWKKFYHSEKSLI